MEAGETVEAIETIEAIEAIETIETIETIKKRSPRKWTPCDEGSCQASWLLLFKH